MKYFAVIPFGKNNNRIVVTMKRNGKRINYFTKWAFGKLNDAVEKCGELNTILTLKRYPHIKRVV